MKTEASMKKLFLFTFLGLIYFTSSLFSQTWSPPKRLTWNSGNSWEPYVAIDSSDQIHLVWADETPGNFEIFYKNSTDGGATWSLISRITWTSGVSRYPNIKIDSNGYIHLIWTDYLSGNGEVFHKKSTDSGITWLIPKRITWNSGTSINPKMIIDAADVIHLVWEDSTTWPSEIFYKQSMDGGKTWIGLKRLCWNSDPSMFPEIAMDTNGTLHVVWSEFIPSNIQIHSKSSPDKGVTWNPLKKLTWNLNFSRSKLSSGSGNRIFCVWQGGTGPGEIYSKVTTDSGVTWSPLNRLTWNSGQSSSSTPILEMGTILHFVWVDDTPGNKEIFDKTSTDSGTTWSVPQRLTWNSGFSWSPRMANDSSNTLYLFWQDDTTGNSEIYLKIRK